MRGAGRSFLSMGRFAAAAFALVGLLGPAHADPTAELASSPAQRCLSPATDDRVKPVDPPTPCEMKIGETAEAEFTFTGPDSRAAASSSSAGTLSSTGWASASSTSTARSPASCTA